MTRIAHQIQRRPGAIVYSLSVALLYLLAGRWITLTQLDGALWQILLALLYFSLPLTLFFQYQSTVNKLLSRQQFLAGSFLFRLFSGRTLGLILALFAGCLAGVFVLLKLAVSSSQAWLLAGLCLPVFVLFNKFLQNRLAGQYRSFMLTFAASRIARLLVPVVPAALLSIWTYIAAPSENLPLQELIAQYRSDMPSLSGSEILHRMGVLMQTWEAISFYILTTAGEGRQVLIAAVAFLQQWMFYYLICTIFSTLLLSANEWRRCFAPLTDSANVPAMSAVQIALVSACSSFILAFILLPLAVYAEFWARQQENLFDQLDSGLAIRLERIGDAWYRPGTADDLQDLRLATLQEMDLSKQFLLGETDRVFAGMAANTDDFLDWYYSLGGEYSRIAHMLSGNLDTFLSDKFTAILQQGGHAAVLDEAMASVLQQNQEIRQHYIDQSVQLLADNQVEPGDVPVHTLATLDLGDVLSPPVHTELSSLQGRLLTSTTGAAGAGLVSSVLAAKLTSRLLAKGSFKVAAKALAKLAASKAGGAAVGAGGGAAAGALAGSFVPGLGTAIGALLGGIGGGVLAGMAIDKAILEFEEAVGREDFQRDILSAIEEARLSVQAQLE